MLRQEHVLLVWTSTIENSGKPVKHVFKTRKKLLTYLKGTDYSEMRMLSFTYHNRIL